jgi:hypothetical protein
MVGMHRHRLLGYAYLSLLVACAGNAVVCVPNDKMGVQSVHMVHVRTSISYHFFLISKNLARTVPFARSIYINIPHNKVIQGHELYQLTVVDLTILACLCFIYHQEKDD